MKKHSPLVLCILLLTSTLPTTIAQATNAAPATLSFCLKLYPAGTQAKPPVFATPKSNKRCDKNFNYFEFSTPQQEIDSLNALSIGDFNAGLALGVYSTIAKLNSALPKTK